MKKLSIIIIIVSGVLLASCSKKLPDYANSIPDNAIAVISMHPLDIYTKGQLKTMETMKEKVKDELFEKILEDPLSTGLMLNEYMYVFAWMEEEAPLIGVISGMKDVEKFEATLAKIGDDANSEITDVESYRYMQPDNEGIIAWSEKLMIVLASPDQNEFEESFWTKSLDWMFNPVKEESVASLVDFKDFQGKMKDLNLWMSTDDMMKLAEKLSKKQMGTINISLNNNYTHMYCEFANGVVNITGETNLSEEVQKNLDEVLVLNPSLNQDILKMTPGGDLLLALAVSMDLEKVQKLVEKFSASDLGEVGDKVEQATGIPSEKLINAFTGDFTLAINGIEGEAMIPIEIFIGFGVKSDEIQKQLMETVGEMVPVEEEGDFFTINIQGNEIYSGMLHDTWVITNANGYKDAVKSGGLDKSLLDSDFDKFSGGSMGMYLNLDFESYPGMVTGMLEQNPERKNWVTKMTEPFQYFGVTAGDQKSLITLKTTEPNENSLYTILKLTESPQ